MRALIVGFGSIGQRHARVLAEMGLAVAVVTRAPETGTIQSYRGLAHALDDWRPDYVVVANTTTDHQSALVEIARSGFSGRLLVEKPLFHRRLALPAGLPPFSVGYNLRCHPMIEALHAAIEGERLVAATLHAGQYLPEWRPSADYRESYSARRALGGGVLRDLSHELDLLLWLLGPWRTTLACFGHWSDLEIDTEDVCAALVCTERCPLATVSLDYLHRRARRFAIIHTVHDTFEVDLVAGSLRSSDGETCIRVDRDQTYREQHRRVLEQNGAGLCSVEEACEVLELIEAMDRSHEQRSWIVRA